MEDDSWMIVLYELSEMLKEVRSSSQLYIFQGPSELMPLNHLCYGVEGYPASGILESSTSSASTRAHREFFSICVTPKDVNRLAVEGNAFCPTTLSSTMTFSGLQQNFIASNLRFYN
ncbi:uncharacterized protein LOC131258058 [Magnolia sinica]|uniref:uncharacterized protein LOC131258058 n=1 Tax=Magnolia sinica TaxID=86752 RepID=UPI0026596264|nr:uncharacterized protein LOC131258058 [Magnolia sinica]